MTIVLLSQHLEAFVWDLDHQTDPRTSVLETDIRNLGICFGGGFPISPILSRMRRIRFRSMFSYLSLFRPLSGSHSIEGLLCAGRMQQAEQNAVTP
jgi:hypothetical protein